MYTNEKLSRLIKAARGEIELDLIITNAKFVDVYNKRIIEGQNMGVIDGVIVGFGDYDNAKEIYDANGKYVSPGLIDGHLHIESTHLCPEELSKVVTPHGTTTLIADPHEIVNVCGIDGLEYMIKAGKRSPLDIKYMLPSCVPATPFETSGAVVDAEAMKDIIKSDEILGLGEFMNYPGLLSCDKGCIDKIVLCKNQGKFIDGHSPNLAGKDLNAYSITGVRNDHECSTIKEMQDRIQNGMYVLLRQGSSCHDLEVLVHGINESNEQRLLFCTDDKMANTIEKVGHIEEHLRICVKNGIHPITAIRIATLNAAKCFHISNRGALCPRKLADFIMFDNLTDFNVDEVFIRGKLVSKGGKYLDEIEREPIDKVKDTVRVKDFNVDKLKLKLKDGNVNIINIKPGGVLTSKGFAKVATDDSGDFVYDSSTDICKVAVVERHQLTGNVAVSLLGNYGIKEGAIGVSNAHDSHNIIVAGTNNDDMALVVENLVKIGGGVVLVKDGKVLYEFPMPIAGIMTDKNAEDVTESLKTIEEIARKELHISEEIDPITTLSFMALAVIPEVKLTDMGMFDVTKFDFMDINA